jgi:hypothetical protein
VVFGWRRPEQMDASKDCQRAMGATERIYDGFEKVFGATICKEIHRGAFRKRL